MKDIVMIKSYTNGISLHLDPDASFEEITEVLARKFADGRAFFGSAGVALSIQGRELTNTEEISIIDTICYNSDLNIVCIVGRDDETNKKYIKALKQVERKLTGGDQRQFYKGTLKDNAVLDTENSVVILGDVNPGCAVSSEGNIIVLGGLYGEAYTKEGNCIAALEMTPERLKIGDFKYKQNKQQKWGVRPKIQPKIAYVKHEKIVFEPLTKELLASF